MRSSRILAPAAAVVAALLVLWPAAAAAQEAPPEQETQETQEAQQVLRVRQVSEPFDIRAAIVQSGLSLGKTLFAITILEADGGAVVPDARVLLRTFHAESGDQGRATAHNTPRTPDRYDAQMDLDHPGLWQVDVDVESPLGLASVELVQLEVPETRRLSGGTYVFIGVFAALLAGVLYLWWSTQRRRRTGRGSDATTTPDQPA